MTRMHGPADRRIVVKSRYKQRRSFIAIAMDTSGSPWRARDEYSRCRRIAAKPRPPNQTHDRYCCKNLRARWCNFSRAMQVLSKKHVGVHSTDSGTSLAVWRWHSVSTATTATMLKRAC